MKYLGSFSLTHHLRCIGLSSISCIFGGSEEGVSEGGLGLYGTRMGREMDSGDMEMGGRNT